MSEDVITGRRPGASGNGMPESGGYDYRGTGRDLLAPGGLTARQFQELLQRPRRPKSSDPVHAKAARAAAPCPLKGAAPSPHCPDCKYLLTAPGHEASCGGAT